MKRDFNPDDPKYVERIEKRLAKTEYVKEFSPPEPDDTVILGTYSRTWRNREKREVLKHKAIEFNGRLDSPTAHTRDYLMSCYDRRPAKKEQRELLKRKRMPIYANPGIMTDAVYLDIKSAWFSIVMLAGWNVEYYPGRWFGFGQPPADFPFKDIKVARSALVSIGRTQKIPLWVKGHLKTQPMYNNTENFHIWGVIADTLNCIASVAISEGARYVNTDGFIISRSKMDFMIDYILDWGLTVKVKAQGGAVICGVGAYQVGSHQTVRGMTFHPCEVIDWEVGEKWLKRRLTHSLH